MVEVTQEAVEATALVLWNREGGTPDRVPAYIRADAIAALEAALPFLASPPVEGRAEVAIDLIEAVHSIGQRIFTGQIGIDQEAAEVQKIVDLVLHLHPHPSDNRVAEPDKQLDRIFIGAGEYVRADEAVKTVQDLNNRVAELERELAEFRSALATASGKLLLADRRAEAAEAELARLKALPSEPSGVREALQKIVDFCDDPNGSAKVESLALGLARLLPIARSALSLPSEAVTDRNALAAAARNDALEAAALTCRDVGALEAERLIRSMLRTVPPPASAYGGNK